MAEKGASYVTAQAIRLSSQPLRLQCTDALVTRMPDGRSTRLILKVAIFLAALTLGSSACASSGSPATGTTSVSSKVTELKGAPAFRESFNRDFGRVRLILLVSPT
jgi:hypothetical protein